MVTNSQDWVKSQSRKIAEKLVLNYFAHIETESKESGVDISKHVSVTFLSYFIASIVYRALIEKPKDPKNAIEMHKFVSENMAAMKLGIQEALSVGFESAIKKFTNKDLEYYCIIKPTPEIKSKLVN